MAVWRVMIDEDGRSYLHRCWTQDEQAEIHANVQALLESVREDTAEEQD